MTFIAAALLGISMIGLVALVIQRVLLSWALRRPPAYASVRPGISILKPLCGADDELETNLLAFSALAYPEYEVLLGVKDCRDAAWPVARKVAERWPSRFRVVLQTGSPGQNPKVNQLVTLERVARHELLFVSDSNTRPSEGQLDELAALFEDAEVACVSFPVSGTGHRSFGALLDNLHLASSVGPGQLAAKALANKDLVVGKAMALRRGALARLGGFVAYANVLAEDYAIGCEVTSRLGQRVAIGRRPVLNVACERTVPSFFRRYLRWGVVHRTAVSLPTSLTQGLLNPWPLSMLAVAAAPSRLTVAGAIATLALKTLLDLSSARRLGCAPLGLASVPAVPVKDALLFVAWVNGLFARTVEWRGHRLRVGPGSHLEEPAGIPPAEEVLS